MLERAILRIEIQVRMIIVCSGDADAKTKPSKHTLKFKRMYGETYVQEDPCWDTHKQVGMKKKGDKMVPNCVYLKTKMLKIE